MFARLAALSLLALACAQAPAGSASDEDIAILEANFGGAMLVPDLIEQFSPQGLLNVAFDGGSAIMPGANLSQSSVGSMPQLSVLPSANATEINGNSKYTVILADADIVGTDEKTTPQTRHWLVNGATLSTTQTPWVVNADNSTSTAITDYAGPAPAEGSGPHRYVFMLFLQPDTFQAPSNLSTAGTPVSTFFVNEYVASSGLGTLVAANYMQVENGVPTGTIPVTTAVDTATIGMATGASGSASGSGSSKTSGSSASQSAPSSSGSGGAAAAKELGWSAIVGGVGVVGAVLGAAVVF